MNINLMATTNSYSISSDVCPLCFGSGRMIEHRITAETERLYGKGKGADFAVECKCKGFVKVKASEFKGRSNIPGCFSRCKIDDFDWSKYPAEKIENTKKYVRSFLINYKNVSKDGIGFYICSKVKGNGKTMLASCIVNTLIEEYGVNAKFVPSYQLIDIVQGKHSDKFGDDAMRTFSSCDVLVIDDIGQKATGQEWMNDLLYQITDERMNSRKPTIFTSNYLPENLPYDDRVKDRVYNYTQMILLPDVHIRQISSKEQKKERYENLIGGAT